MTKFKISKIRFLLPDVCALILLCSLLSGVSGLNAQQTASRNISGKESIILANPKDMGAVLILDELSREYFTRHEYAKFALFLKKLEKKKVPLSQLPVAYYIALNRQKQLKYLEDTQNWQEYFDLRNAFRQEIFSETEKVISQCPGSSFGLKAQVINWLAHKALNDDQAQVSLQKLMALAASYSKQPAADINAIKEAADSLAKEEEKAKAKAVYNLYADALIRNETDSGKLLSCADAAVSEGNIELSEGLYSRYIEMISGSPDKDSLAKGLISIADKFVATGWVKGKDPFFAEGVFKKLAQFGLAADFSQDLRYLRAYNLQRIRDYPACLREYEILINSFPDSVYTDEALFKMGILSIYITRHKAQGLSFLQKVIERNRRLEYVAESLYHQSLISQYEKDFLKADTGYQKISDLISRDAGGFQDLANRLEERRSEIKDSKEIEYNLKVFLDNTLFDAAEAGEPLETEVQAQTSGGVALELSTDPLKSLKGSSVEFSSAVGLEGTGCLSPELTYLWSGDLGGINLVPAEPNFTTEYKSSGTKVVNLAVLAPSGVIGTRLDMVDIYQEKETPASGQ